jgi:hypothetical protein
VEEALPGEPPSFTNSRMARIESSIPAKPRKLWLRDSTASLTPSIEKTASFIPLRKEERSAPIFTITSLMVFSAINSPHLPVTRALHGM